MRKVLTYLIFIAIAVLFTYLSYWTITKDDAPGENSLLKVWEIIKSANWVWVIISMIMGYLAIISRGLRWKLLLRPLGHEVNTWNSIHSVAIGYFSNLAVPRSGEIARCTVLNSTDHVSVDRLIGTVISERIIDFIFLFIFTGLAVGLNTQAFSNFLEYAELDGLMEKGTLAAWAFGIFMAVMIFLWFFRKRIKQMPVYTKIVNFLKGIKDGILTVKNMEQKWAFMAHTIFIWGMYFLMAIVVFQSLEETRTIGLAHGLFIMVAGGFGMVLPSPGGTGTYVFAVTTAFTALALSKDDGAAYGSLVWAAQTAMMIIGGVIGFVMTMRAKVKDQEVEAA